MSKKIDYCPCPKCFGCSCEKEECSNAKEGRCDCEQERELQTNLSKLLKKNGCRSVLASLICVLNQDRVDEIDDELIKNLDKAGAAYALSMGLQWYTPLDYLKN